MSDWPRLAASARSEPSGDVGNRAPEFQRIANWINSEPLTMEDLRGKVILIDFWTYSCVNCIRTMTYLREWHDKYAKECLVIVGVHAPEFDFEKLTENMEASVEELDLTYPIAKDDERGT
ncbi:MAG: redoxin domain-containing protein [Chloroflexota bacterium]|nr:redoxin domain-containing protein [Chloroflexota bacterium]